MSNPDYVVYADPQGFEHTETVTSPIALVFREEELEAQGCTIIH